MAIHHIELFRDDEGRTVERRTNTTTNEVSFYAHFKDVVYNEKHNLTANCLVDLQAQTLEFAFQVFDERRQKKQNELTISFIEFLEANPDKKAAMEARDAVKERVTKPHVPLTGDRLVKSPETANEGKKSLFRV